MIFHYLDYLNSYFSQSNKFIYLLNFLDVIIKKSNYLRSNFLKTLGPGILFASTAIGVSHLVQSTRAGAEYGFAMLIFIILANVMKYPFFEFGSRYANITGLSLLDGYYKKGKWLLYIYIMITFCTMFVVLAAVSYVCSGLMIELVGIEFNIENVVLCLFLICFSILASGRFSLLDHVVKLISLILLISTFLAFLFTIHNGPVFTSAFTFLPVNLSDSDILFLIALMGWMPTAVDMSVWNSIWTIERIEQTQYKPSLKETLLDFNIGYFITIFLSICFVTLGAFIMYGGNEALPNSSTEFAARLVGLYTLSLGDWAYWIIIISAFSVMFSTTLAVFDGYARSIQRSFELLLKHNKSYIIYLLSLVVIGAGAYLIIFNFMSNFKELIDLATTISFLIAPFCAIVNHIIIFSDDIPIDKQPPLYLKFLSIFGIFFLLAFSLIFLIYV
jgi:Mn2+/Fe2+ NRAMP family transporter